MNIAAELERDKSTMGDGSDKTEKTLVERKKRFKKLLLKWHPDKQQDEKQKFLATCVFQWLQEVKDWYLA